MSGVCHQCGGSVVWKQIPNPKRGTRWQCFEVDGVTVHWDTCSKNRMRQVRVTGELFETETEGGYRKSVHGTKLTWMTAGKPYNAGKVAICSQACAIPPWTDCSSCPEGLGVRP